MWLEIMREWFRKVYSGRMDDVLMLLGCLCVQKLENECESLVYDIKVQKLLSFKELEIETKMLKNTRLSIPLYGAYEDFVEKKTQPEESFRGQLRSRVDIKRWNELGADSCEYKMYRWLHFYRCLEVHKNSWFTESKWHSFDLQVGRKTFGKLIVCSYVSMETWRYGVDIYSCEYKIQKLQLCFHGIKLQVWSGFKEVVIRSKLVYKLFG